MYGTSSSSVCVDFINMAVQIFNNKLIPLVDELNNNLQDAKFIYVDIFNISSTPTPGIKVKTFSTRKEHQNYK